MQVQFNGNKKVHACKCNFTVISMNVYFLSYHFDMQSYYMLFPSHPQFLYEFPVSPGEVFVHKIHCHSNDYQVYSIMIL